MITFLDIEFPLELQEKVENIFQPYFSNKTFLTFENNKLWLTVNKTNHNNLLEWFNETHLILNYDVNEEIFANSSFAKLNIWIDVSAKQEIFNLSILGNDLNFLSEISAVIDIDYSILTEDKMK